MAVETHPVPTVLPEAPAPSPDKATKTVINAVRVLAGCAAVAILRYAGPVLMPVLLAVLLFYALDPIVDWLEKRKAPRLLASTVVVLALMGSVTAGAFALWPQFDAVIEQIPEGADKLRTSLRKLRVQDSALTKVQEAAKALDSAAAEAAPPDVHPPGVMKVQVEQPPPLSGWLWNGGMSMLGTLAQAITILFLTIFLLNEDDKFKRKLVHQTSTLGNKRITVQILNDIAKQIERFIWVQVFTSGVVAVATAIVLWWVGMKQSIVWGLLAGILNIVPYYGPLIVTAVLCTAGFLQFGTLWQATEVGVIALVITTIEGMFLTPHLLSRAASLNQVAIFLAIAFWSWAWGIAGMLLAVPLLMATKAVCDHIEGLRPIAELLGE